ncbi:hypothetical protein SD81_002920 [Tolypothrix campylonemoides VB511288]|nr:hypothetical protein SD81_002920 [Tolypothrix campylonemoides VB511288]
MFTPALDTSADLAIALLIHYSFDLSGYSASELVDLWQKQYPGNWLHLAVIEALYQGRYKAISVQQILTCWQRRGQAIFHFNMEFERLICSKFPQNLTSVPALPPAPKETRGQEGEINSKFKIQNSTIRVSPPSPSSPSSPSSPPSAPSPSHPTSHSSPANQQKDDLLPVATNNPPIGQFTPETSALSESFTSKLKAISNEKQLPSGKLIPARLRTSVSQEIGNDNSYC